MLWLRTTSLTRLALWCTVIVTALLGGCVAVRPAQKANASLLLTAVITGDQPTQLQPVALLVTLDDMSAGTTRQFVFDASSRIPGHRVEFLVRMEVPAGHHRLSRATGTTADGTPIDGVDFNFAVDVEARAGATDYLGHLEMSTPAGRTDPSASPAHLVIADAYEDDLPDFVHAWPELRRRKIAHRAPQQTTTVALAQPLSRETGEREQVRAEPLDAAAASQLPRRSQVAFAVFLQSKYPRAFAIGASGATGLAVGGSNVIERALRDCKRAQVNRRQPCQLFALDDTLMQSLQGSSGRSGAQAKR